jgi:hypothetical protein
MQQKENFYIIQETGQVVNDWIFLQDTKYKNSLIEKEKYKHFRGIMGL